MSTRILLAEDSPMLAAIMLENLGASGYDVKHARNGKEVLDHPDLDTFDVIIMDIQMPVMGGLEASRLLKSIGIRAPIIACSGLCDSRSEQDMLDAGCTDYVLKPVDFPAFFALIEKRSSAKNAAH